ncbi:hypothetical protein QBC32DRAFT_329050 [Pseudoneurospora amorphoporcata]|uniref:JmjC domain-containing protein n=1 Tax=Pseudoneurospora amorphoporcata TaxID=241081 RepID=A0AAN6SB74_9PEZI|nr:hypothetical protein QBC32DRAFT_329050 [Pseudoneurospora amorphoporcata]
MEALKSEIESIKLQIQRLCSFAETNLQESTPSSSSPQTDVISSAIQQVLEVLNHIDNKLNELTTTSSTSSISSTSSTSPPSIPDSTNTAGPPPIPKLNSIGPNTLQPFTKDNLGLNLITNLHKLETDPHFRGKVCVSIADLGIDWKDLAKRALPLPDHDQFAVQHDRDDDGFSRLYLSHSTTMTSINFDFDLNLLTDDKAKQFLQDIVESPPQNTIPYYVGPIDTSGIPLASLFPSGALSILGDLPGINTLYMHMGERGSGTAFHCEDAHLRSYNLNIYGWKLWIMIDPDDTAKFERMLATKFPLHKCNQSVRHLNVMVSPKRLRQEGIKFDIIRAGPGDLVITRPRQYHAILNQTPSLAIATNYTLLGEQAIPPAWVVCPRDGLYSLSHDNLEKLPNEPPTKKRKASATALPYRKRKNTRQSRGISNVAGNNNVKPRYYQDNEEQNKQQDEQQDEEDGEGYAQRHDQQQEQQDNQEDDNEEEEEEEDEEDDEENEVHDHQHNQEHDQQHQAQYNHQKYGNNENGNQNSDNETDADTDIESGRRLASLTIDHNAILRFMSISHRPSHWDLQYQDN